MNAPIERASGFVSWDEQENASPIEGEVWVYPSTDSPENRTELGELRHLELLTFPEGYQAVQIVRSATGEVMHGTNALDCYQLPSNSNDLTGKDGSRLLHNHLTGKKINLDNGLEVVVVDSFSDGTETTVMMTADGAASNKYAARDRTRIKINPLARELFMCVDWNATGIEGAQLSFEAREGPEAVESRINFWTSNRSGGDIDGQIALDLGGDGLVSAVRVYRSGLLKALGLQLGQEMDTVSDHWTQVTDRKQRKRIHGALAEAWGLNNTNWRGFDLRLTASGIYAAICSRDVDPTTALAIKS